MKYNILIFLFLFVFSVELSSASRSAAFLRIGADARYISMGRAATALAQGPTAIYWNPANIIKDAEISGFGGISISYMNLPNWDVNYSAMFTSVNYKNLAIGAGMLYYSVTDIPGYDSEMNFTNNFSNNELAYLISSSLNMGSLMNMGVTFYYIEQNYSLVGSPSSNGYGLQYGIQFIPIPRFNNLSVALKIADNFSVKNAEISIEDSTSLILTTAMALSKKNRNKILNGYKIGIDLEQERHTPMRLRFGIELSLLQTYDYQFFFRAGMDDIVLEYEGWLLGTDNLWSENLFEEEKFELIGYEEFSRLQRKYTYGLGFKWKRTNLSLDYGLIIEAYRTMNFITLSYGR